jgi:hypothetical protein
MFSLGELSCLPTTSSTNDDLEEHMIELDNIFEYDKLNELLDTVQYYDKLLSQYGYDVKKGEWNTRDFPITQNDKQMEGIKSDVQEFRIAADEYNKYLEYLAEKYDIDFNDIGNCRFIIPNR